MAPASPISTGTGTIRRMNFARCVMALRGFVSKTYRSDEHSLRRLNPGGAS